MKGSSRFNVGIVTFPLKKSGFVPIQNLVNIITSISESICIISGVILNERKYTDKKTIINVFMGGVALSKSCMNSKNFSIYLIEHNSRSNNLARVIEYLYTQLKITYAIIRNLKNIDLWIFFIGGDGLVLPMFILRLFRKKPTLLLSGSTTYVGKIKNDPFTKFLLLLSSITYTLSFKIIVYSPNLIKEWNLKKYKNKILVAHRHFLDFNKFKMYKPSEKRENIIGYIGRLGEEKGVLNFVEAIPEILKEKGDIKFLIGGDGQLRDKIEKYIRAENLSDKVKLVGWIPHDKLPDYLNELKLFVLPSYTEGLPNIMLEAMACGTPVLATPVGAIPDIINDGKTGFIMENNSPECIARNVIRALDDPSFNKIAEKALRKVRKKFTFEYVVEKWTKILNEYLKELDDCKAR